MILYLDYNILILFQAENCDSWKFENNTEGCYSTYR